MNEDAIRAQVFWNWVSTMCSIENHLDSAQAYSRSITEHDDKIASTHRHNAKDLMMAHIREQVSFLFHWCKEDKRFDHMKYLLQSMEGWGEMVKEEQAKGRKKARKKR